MLLAESYPETVTTSVVWLVEQGVDIALRKYQAYQTAGDETILTVSQIYPVADIASFMVGPRLIPAKPQESAELPDVEWSAEDFAILISLGFPVPTAVLNACAEHPGEWISSKAIYQRAGVTQPSGAAQLAGFGFSVRTRFARGNHPWETQWKAGGENLNYYRIDSATADRWHAALGGQQAGITPAETGGDQVEGDQSIIPVVP